MKFNTLKRVLCLLILLVVPILTFAEGQANTLFEKGNALYKKGEFKQALETYQLLINDGYQSAGVYFNMGNASYKSGDIPLAILYYEKAHKLNPADEDINFNIRFANSKTTDKIDEVPEFFLANWWKKIILGFSISTLSVFSVLFVLLASGMLVVYFFTNSVSIKKLSFYTAISLFSLGIISLFISDRQMNYFNAHKQAIVFSGSVSVKNAPVSSSATLFIVHDGTKVNILENNNDWMRVRIANGNEGWIKVGDVKDI